MLHPPKLPIKTRKGTLSNAGWFLQKVLEALHARKGPSKNPGPFAPLHIKEDDSLPDSVYKWAFTPTHALWIWSDHSALLLHTPKGHTTLVLPNIYQVDFKATTTDCPRGLHNTTPQQRQAWVEAVWGAHANGPTLAFATHTPSALRPQPDTFWSPHGPFPNTTTYLHLPIRPHNTPTCLTTDVVQAYAGFVLDLLPVLAKHDTWAVELKRRAWDPEEKVQIRALTKAQNIRDQIHHATITKRTLHALWRAIPALAASVGTSQWASAKPAVNPSPCLVLQVHGFKSAHTQLAVRAAWQRCQHQPQRNQP